VFVCVGASRVPPAGHPADQRGPGPRGSRGRGAATEGPSQGGHGGGTGHTRYLLPVFRIPIHLIRIRIQQFRLNTDPDPGFCQQKIEKNLINL
jgi:hypothetical protein